MGSDFYVWTHVYDVSGIPDDGVMLWVRADHDGVNPIESIQNETFEGGDEVDEWVAIPMTVEHSQAPRLTSMLQLIMVRLTTNMPLQK